MDKKGFFEAIELLRNLLKDSVASSPTAGLVFVALDVRQRNLYGRGLLDPKPIPAIPGGAPVAQAQAALALITNTVGNDLSKVPAEVGAAVSSLQNYLYSGMQLAAADVTSAANTIGSWVASFGTPR